MNSNRGQTVKDSNELTSRSKTSTLETVTNSDNKQKKYMIKGRIYLNRKLKIILVVILGDVNVGKSNIIRRILGHDFQELEATVGVEFGLIDVKDVDPDDPNVVLSIQIWDTCIKNTSIYKNIKL
jgi:hypothetical protein